MAFEKAEAKARMLLSLERSRGRKIALFCLRVLLMDDEDVEESLREATTMRQVGFSRARMRAQW